MQFKCNFECLANSALSAALFFESTNVDSPGACQMPTNGSMLLVGISARSLSLLQALSQKLSETQMIRVNLENCECIIGIFLYFQVFFVSQ